MRVGLNGNGKGGDTRPRFTAVVEGEARTYVEVPLGTDDVPRYMSALRLEILRAAILRCPARVGAVTEVFAQA